MSVPEVHPLPDAAVSSRGRAWSFLVGGDIAYSVLAAGFWLVLARAVSAPGLGDVALATALSLPALVVLDGGLAQYLVREARPADGGGLPHALRPALRRRAVGLVLLPPAIAVAMLVLGDTDHRLLIGLLIGLSASFEGAAHGWLAAPRARGDMRPDARFRGLYGALTLLVVVVLWAAGDLTALLAAGATAAGAGLAAASVAFGHRSTTRRWVDRAVEEPRVRRRFTVVMLLGSAFQAADVLVVGAALGSAALAPYALASKLVAALRILPAASLRVSLSWAARRADPSASDEARGGFRMGLALACAGVVAGPWGASLLFGSSYGRAMLEPLVLLSASLVFAGLKAPLAGRHLGAGDTRFLVRASLVSVGALAVALPLGVAAFDATGAALAVLVAEAIGISLYVRRRGADGWALAGVWPRPVAVVVLIAAVVAGLLLPRFSAVELVPALIAALAALDPPLARRAR